jgi:uncharacterized protein (TIGR02118 family)
MIKVTVMTPQREGARFDHACCRDSHMPMVKAAVGAACTGDTVAKGLGGGTPGSPAPDVADCELFFDSVPAFQQAFAPQGKAIMADVPNDIDITPVMQVSDVVV